MVPPTMLGCSNAKGFVCMSSCLGWILLHYVWLQVGVYVGYVEVAALMLYRSNT